MNDTARAMFVRVFGYGGMMFGVAVSYAIVGCPFLSRDAEVGRALQLAR